ncbi:hypothetical protein WJX74_000787 [Apatococcus lobatus]|uniref:protein-ribulosamine 3-kinase n=1 Tax=Apatococcus lobatus TaxID=904363 RepID=A0AAW1RHV0_9CHLO
MAKKDDPLTAIGDWIGSSLEYGSVKKSSSLGSSGWSSQYTYETESGKKVFAKIAFGEDVVMFKGEALGLNAMYDTNTLRIPKIYHYGALSELPGGGNRGSFIIMEHLNFGSGRASSKEFGRQLARMHAAKPSDENAAKGLFGFHVDNTIGGNPQPNGWMDNWVDFFRERRLGYQLSLSTDSKLKQMGQKLMKHLDKFFEGVEVKPCVLHGDLWSGNISSVDGQPAIFDPAVYYGHSEAEFGMSWCAGFSQDFYAGYHEVMPKAPGFEARKQIYSLYHYLNHNNLFGGSYYYQCESTLSALTRGL